jgi:flagellar protein FliS
MIASQQAHRYREVAIKTANPLQLVVILYDGAINALQEAQEHLKRKDIVGRARCLNRAVAMISELQACLNFKEGGSIAGSLDQLYNYMKRRIFKANLDQRPEPLAEVVALLESLRAAWGELVVQSQNAGIPGDVASSASSSILKNGTTDLGSLNISG